MCERERKRETEEACDSLENPVKKGHCLLLLLLLFFWGGVGGGNVSEI